MNLNRKSHFETFRLRKILFKHLNYPLYVPEAQRTVLAVLAERGISGLVTEIQRLNSLGSAWAASTLGYLSLLPSADGARNPERAIELCAKAAADGDAYALFVSGWARYTLTRDRVSAARLVFASSKMDFIPATLTMSFFLWPETDEALKFVAKAAKLGHKAAWSMQCGYWKTGRLGIAKQVLGYALTPFARVWYVLALWINPFSDRVFFINLGDQRPGFRTPVVVVQ